MNELNVGIRFCGVEHKNFFLSQTSLYDNVYKRAFFYAIGVCPTTREHVASLYNFDNQEIIPAAIDAAWQTSVSKKVTRLAFNLFTDGVPTAHRFNSNEEEMPVTGADREEASLYSTSDIFCCEYALFFWEAVKLRYPEYASDR